MIPLRDQDAIRQRFGRDLTSRVRIDYFTQKSSPLYVAGRQDCVYCKDVKTLLEELAALSDRISLSLHELASAGALAKELGVDKVPGIVVRGGANRPVRFFGIPAGNEFAGFIETLIDAARSSVDLRPETAKQLRKLKSDARLQVFVTPTCPYCPALARTALKLGLASARVKADVVEASEFPALVQRYAIRAVPTTVINDKLILAGAMDEAALVQQIFRTVEGKAVAAGTAAGAATALSAAAPAAGAGGLVLPR